FAGGAVAGGILSGGGAILGNIGRGTDARTDVQQKTRETQTIGRDAGVDAAAQPEQMAKSNEPNANTQSQPIVNASESLVDRALQEQTERGTISNSTAEAILADGGAMDAIGVRIESGMTKSQQRAAAKEAVSALANRMSEIESEGTAENRVAEPNSVGMRDTEIPSGAKTGEAEQRSTERRFADYGDESGLMESEVSKNMSAEDVEFIDTMLKAVGAKGIITRLHSDYANADIENGFVTIYANADDASEAYRSTVKHEVTHRIKELGAKAYSDYEATAVSMTAKENGVPVSKLISDYQNRYREQAGQALTVDQAREEIAADFAMHLNVNAESAKEFVNQSVENRSAARKILDTIRDVIKAIREKFTGKRMTSDQQTFISELQNAEKLWATALGEAGRIVNETAADWRADTDYDGIGVEDVKHSLKNDKKFMEKARRKNESTGFVSEEAMNDAEEARSVIANLFRDPALQDSLNLPQDVMGKTFLSNSSYGGSEENTTVCIRTLAAEYLMDAVAEEIGRPLTVEDTIAISQEYWKYTDKPECLYCYVAMDRKAQREFLGRYLEMRDEVVSDIRNGMSIDEAREKFLEGHGRTNPMKNRFEMWARNAVSNADVITPRDLASPKNMELAAARSKSAEAQINDALKYAQSASWAKKRISYRAYDNHILKWKQKRVNELNDHYGLR
ncbi:MAG: hypothetical protein PUJ93_06605, partial [Oscillospiraceae bacterium]|nr:hypothetical protein [Oscillospiraceae bacterium]MDY5736401.1 hypothetical protein [Oscillospiraceae bacterium]